MWILSLLCLYLLNLVACGCSLGVKHSSQAFYHGVMGVFICFFAYNQDFIIFYTRSIFPAAFIIIKRLYSIACVTYYESFLFVHLPLLSQSKSLHAFTARTVFKGFSLLYLSTHPSIDTLNLNDDSMCFGITHSLIFVFTLTKHEFNNGSECLPSSPIVFLNSFTHRCYHTCIHLWQHVYGAPVGSSR